MKEKYVPARSHFFPRSILHLGKEMSTETRENIVGHRADIFSFFCGEVFPRALSFRRDRRHFRIDRQRQDRSTKRVERQALGIFLTQHFLQIKMLSRRWKNTFRALFVSFSMRPEYVLPGSGAQIRLTRKEKTLSLIQSTTSSSSFSFRR